MFCPKCNAQVPDDMQFCLQCGEKIEPAVEASLTEEPVTEEAPAQDPIFTEAAFQLNLEGAMPEEPKKKKLDKKKKKLLLGIIAGVTALAVLVVSLLGFLAWDWGLYVRDFFDRMKSPEDYKNLVEQRALSDESPTSELGIIKKAVMTYYTAFVEAPETNGTSMGVQLMVGDGLKDMLGKLEGLSGSLDPQTQALLELVQVLDQIDINLDAVVEESAMQVLLDLGLNGQDLIGAQVVVDGEKMYLDLPGLTNQAVEISLKEMGIDPATFAMYTKLMQASEEFKANLPSAEAVSGLLDRCLVSAIEQIDQVERENSSIKAGGVTQKVTVLTYEIDAQTAADMGLAILKEAENDETLLQLLQAYEAFAADVNKVMADAGMEDQDDLYPTIDANEAMNAIAEARQELEEFETEDESQIIIETYVNKKGQIIGRSIRPEEDEGEISYMATVSGRKIGFQAEVDMDGEKMVLDGNLTYKQGKLSGSGAMEHDGEELVCFTLSNYDLKAKSGTMTICLGEELQDMLDEELDAAAMVISTDLELEITFREKDYTVWLLMDGDQILGLHMNYDAREDATVTVPENAATDPEKWAESIDPQVLLDRLEKVGITEDMLNALMGAMEDTNLDTVL